MTPAVLLFKLCISTSLVVGYVSAFILPNNHKSLITINAIPSAFSASRNPISCNPSCNSMFSSQTFFQAGSAKTSLSAKKKSSSGKGKKTKSEQSSNRDDELPAADALRLGGKEEENKAGLIVDSKELKFQRDRSLDALIIEEPKGQRLDDARTSLPFAKRPLIEIPDEAIVPDPKTRSSEDSAVDADAAFGLSGVWPR